MGIREDTWTYIKEAHDGLIRSEEGRATSVIAEAMNVSVTHASGVLRDLEEQGYLARRINGRRTYTIETIGDEPPADEARRRSTPKVDVEALHTEEPEPILIDMHAQRADTNGHLPDRRPATLSLDDTAIEALALRLLKSVLNETTWKDRFEGLVQEMQTSTAASGAKGKEVKALQAQVRDLKASLADRSDHVNALEAQVSTLTERVRIAEHNAEVWKSKAQTSSQLVDLRSILRKKDRQVLDELMKELPTGR